MNVSENSIQNSDAMPSVSHRLVMLMPVAAALSYPYWLKAFHEAVAWKSAPVLSKLLAGFCLFAALAVPLLGLLIAGWLSRPQRASLAYLRARRVAYLSVAAPPMFVFAGVALGLLHAPIKDVTLWSVGWLIAGAYAASGRGSTYVSTDGVLASWRVAHGASAALITCFVLFHLANHMAGWMGPQIHAAVMEQGQQIYRSTLIEPILVSLLLFQVASGTRLLWRWSVAPADGYRVFQVASGAYLAMFIIAHLNSALVSARYMRGAETDWAWASGAPDGLILDAWNIRLLPHYAFGVLFVLAHLSSGLRQVLIAHGVDAATANRIWAVGLMAGAVVSATILLGLCGARI